MKTRYSVAHVIGKEIELCEKLYFKLEKAIEQCDRYNGGGNNGYFVVLKYKNRLAMINDEDPECVYSPNAAADDDFKSRH